jgi:hypothetical protein
MKLLYILMFMIASEVYALDTVIPTSAIRTTDMKDICTTLTSTVRNVPQSLKKKVYIRDKGDLSKTKENEVDHRIALSSGGSNDISNLKLQSYFGNCNARHKDVLEVRIHSLICKQKMKVSVAQDILYNHWEKGYEAYIDPKGCK